MDKDAQDEVMTNSKQFYVFDTIQLYYITIQLYLYYSITFFLHYFTLLYITFLHYFFIFVKALSVKIRKQATRMAKARDASQGGRRRRYRRGYVGTKLVA